MNYIKNSIMIFVLALILIGCGDPEIDLTSAQYEPKIVVEGYLYPGESIKEIIITRNFPLNSVIDSTKLILFDAVVKINDKLLTFNPLKLSFEDNSTIIEYGKSYELKVYAKIDGKELFASSITTVPVQGFNIHEYDLGTKRYMIDPISFTFTPSPSNDFYAMSVMPDSANLDNFIYDNPFEPGISRDDLEKYFNNFRFQAVYLSNVNVNSPTPITHTLKGFDTWFYSSYKLIMYSGDKNFKDFFVTAKRVEEFDGNFHEPVMNFTGDGIGVFASAIKDTLVFKIIK